jgi:hypothetical protein
MSVALRSHREAVRPPAAVTVFTKIGARESEQYAGWSYCRELSIEVLGQDLDTNLQYTWL